MYSVIVGEGLETAVFDLQTSFWGLNRSEFNQESSHDVQQDEVFCALTV